MYSLPTAASVDALTEEGHASGLRKGTAASTGWFSANNASSAATSAECAAPIGFFFFFFGCQGARAYFLKMEGFMRCKTDVFFS